LYNSSIQNSQNLCSRCVLRARIKALDDATGW